MVLSVHTFPERKRTSYYVTLSAGSSVLMRNAVIVPTQTAEHIIPRFDLIRKGSIQVVFMCSTREASDTLPQPSKEAMFSGLSTSRETRGVRMPPYAVSFNLCNNLDSADCL